MDTLVAERFWRKVDKDGATPAHRPDLGPCWPWAAGRNNYGYGVFSFGSRKDGSRRSVSAHRFAYELLIGPITEGLQLDHLCRVHHCVNTDHLEPVTQRENLLRGVGIPALNMKKTHCPHGHAFDGVNTYWHKGTRGCLVCRRVSHQRSRLHQKEGNKCSLIR